MRNLEIMKASSYRKASIHLGQIADPLQLLSLGHHYNKTTCSNAARNCSSGPCYSYHHE